MREVGQAWLGLRFPKLSVVLLSQLAMLCLLLHSGLSFCAEKPFRLFLEAEDFDGLTYRPFHDLKAESWYVREANCRGYGTVWGNGKVAAIHSPGRPWRRNFNGRTS